MAEQSGGHDPPNSQGGPNSSSRRKSALQDLQYNKYDTGPFKIMMQHSEHNVGNLHPVELGKLLHEKHIEGIKNIEKKGKNRVAITFKTPTEANNFKNNESIAKLGYKTFIPATLISCKGVVKGVGVNITEEEVIKKSNEESENVYKVLEVRRLNRRVEDKTNHTISYVPTGTYIFTFQGKSFPRQPHLITEQLKNPDGCDELLRQKRINEIMSFENVSYFDANKKVPRKHNENTDNYIASIVPDLNNFPPIARKTVSNELISISQRAMTSHPNNSKSYKDVASGSKRKCPSSPPYDKQTHDKYLLNLPLYPNTPIKINNKYNSNSIPETYKKATPNSQHNSSNLISPSKNISPSLNIEEIVNLTDYFSNPDTPVEELISYSQTLNSALEKRGVTLNKTPNSQSPIQRTGSMSDDMEMY